MGQPNADVEFQKRMVTCDVFPSKVHWRVPRKSIFDTKFDPQNGPRSPRGHPKPGSDTERGSQSASSAPPELQIGENWQGARFSRAAPDACGPARFGATNVARRNLAGQDDHAESRRAR